MSNNIKKLVKEEVNDFFSKRENEERQFFKIPLVKNLQSKGFIFHLFSVGAKPDGFYLAHKSFDGGDEYGDVISLKYTGDTLLAALNKLKKLNPNPYKTLFQKLEGKALADKIVVSHGNTIDFRTDYGGVITLSRPQKYSDWVKKAQVTKKNIRVVAKRAKEINTYNPYLAFFDVGFLDPRFLPWGPTPDSSRAHVLFFEGGKQWSNGTFDGNDVWVDVHFKSPEQSNSESFWQRYIGNQ